jgi:hypothetical protein
MQQQIIMEYTRKHFDQYEVEFNKHYIRIGHWERGDTDFEQFLESVGYVLDVYQDEDRGNLYSYKKCVMGVCMGDKYIAQTNFLKPQLIVEAVDIAAPDEQNAGDVIFLADDGNKYFERELLLIKSI